MAEFDQITASKAVLMEVANVLGAFRDDLVIVGGWVPALLYPRRGHMGSVDVDLAVAPTALGGNVYQTIFRRMLEAGYTHKIDPTRFIKKVRGAPEPVKVDLISGQIQGGKKSTIIQVDELQLSCLKGTDLAFDGCDEIEIAGQMPDGSRNVVRMQIVRPEIFILLKAFALDERTKFKDAYDIAFILHNFEPNLMTLADRLRPHVAKGLGREALEILRNKFASIDSVGPDWAAQAMPGTGDYEQPRRAAFEDAQELFRLVGLD